MREIRNMMNLEAMEIIETITDVKGWIFKMRRLPGKDYIVEFKKLARRPLEAMVYSSNPHPTLLQAVRECVDSILKRGGLDETSIYESGTISRLTELLGCEKD